MGKISIRQKLCPTERYGIKCPFTRKASRIVVHNTANDAPAENEISYMLNRPEEVSFHFAVDDKEAVQGLPLERNAWASGDGQGAGNMEGIHIEICYSLSGGERFRKAEENAAKLIAGLLAERGWGLDRVTKHQDYDGKYCPHRTLDQGWERFLSMVRKELDGDGKEAKPLVEANLEAWIQRREKERAAKPVSGWAEEAWEKAVAAKIFDGSKPQEPLTREQCAVVLERLGLLEKEQVATPQTN